MSADRNLMRTLAEARPDRLDPDPGHRPDPAGIMARGRSVEVRGPARRPGRRLILAGAVPVVAAVAAGVVFLGPAEPPTGQTAVSGQSGPSAPVPSPASARELLLVAAERSGHGGATTGRYLVVTKEDGEIRTEGPAGRKYHIVRRMSFERWYPTKPGEAVIEFYQSLGARPVGPGDEAAWRADGSPGRWVEPPPAGLPDAKPVVIEAAPGPRGYVRMPVAETDPEVGWYPRSELPTEPAALRRYLVGRWKAYSGDRLSDFELFRTGADIAFSVRLPAEVRAAAFRMLAGIDGVQSLGQVADQRGRAGVAVGYARKGDSGNWVQPRLIIDPGTGQPLAQESWRLGPGKAAATGELLGYTLMTGFRYTDEAPPVESARPRGRSRK